MYGISNKIFSRLQVVQNQAAKLIVGGLKFDYASPILKNLHWLPMRQRILFKLGVMVYKCLNGLVPKYLSDKCVKVSSRPFGKCLRSVDINTLFIRNRNLKIADRDFEVAAPLFWNSLPSHLRQRGLTLFEFKRGLKTHLFDN